MRLLLAPLCSSTVRDEARDLFKDAAGYNLALDEESALRSLLTTMLRCSKPDVCLGSKRGGVMKELTDSGRFFVFGTF